MWLSDVEWASIARELLHDAGVATHGDRGGPRWVAIRHAEDHIHIAAVLVRQDTSSRFRPRNDCPKPRQRPADRGPALRLAPPLRFTARPGALRIRLPRHASGLSPASSAHTRQCAG
ncbi:hypothetical protein LWC35_38560 [Pseudonocardia kujensis]|uniref:hypothetical protein n=1 Tax=Pseudonocardia kujensis TaxID=1128675 RepID=UPI001E3B2F2C|nr:hypothetical protein [Pseudonocardia kujensis]MCE0768757.1 hypothetical protein [Pseudonocardia kujensis]